MSGTSRRAGSRAGLQHEQHLGGAARKRNERERAAGAESGKGVGGGGWDGRLTTAFMPHMSPG